MRRFLGFAACVLSLSASAALSVAGCGNDFDGLFEQGTSATEGDGGDTTTPRRDSGGQSTGDDEDTPINPGKDAATEMDATTTQDAAPKPPLCTPAVTTCDRVQDNDCDDDHCQNSCSGCQCTCDPITCKNNEDQCTTTCSGGSSCTVTCGLDGPCILIGHKTTSAKMTCQGQAKQCSMSCDQGGSCEVDCTEGNCGGSTCAADTTCLLRCVSGTAGCALDCQGGVSKNCGVDGTGATILTCNRDCP